MMLIIPAIDLIDGKCVRLHQGRFDEKIVYPMDPVAQAVAFREAGFSRIHIVDLSAARSGRRGPETRQTIPAIARLGVPVQIGGGIRCEADAEELIEMGVAYLIVGTAAVEEPETVAGWIARWGAERWIVSLDLQRGELRTRGWFKKGEASLEQIAGRLTEWGVAQVIFTDVERDGTMTQPNYESFRSLRRRLPESIRILAAGGVAEPGHIAGLREAGASGAIVGRALYEGNSAWSEFLKAGKG